KAHGISNGQNAIDLLLQSFRSEAQLAGNSLAAVHLIDENVQQQKAYPEFLMYGDLFSKGGAEFNILEFNDPNVTSKNAFIYNRYTDFTFRLPESAGLRKAYLTGALFSPNPWEYLILADKSRLVDFAEAGVSDVLIPQKHFRE